MARKSAFLNVRETRPGDVILETSAGHGLVPWVVRSSTGSRYTHATMLVTRIGQLEAPEEDGRVRIRVGDILRDAAGRILVDLRCPDAMVLRVSADHERRWRAGGNRGPLPDEVGRTVFAYLGRDYATRRELADAAPPLMRVALRAFTRAPAAHPVVRRWFCSNLVAQVYDDVGVSLVHEGPRRATPKKLLRSHVLTSIPSAVTRLDETECAACELRASEGELKGAGTVGALNALILAAVAAVGTAGVQRAARDLDRDISALLGQAGPGYRALLAFEAQILDED